MLLQFLSLVFKNTSVMDGLCALASWAVSRSLIIILNTIDNNDHLLKYFAGINILTISTALLDLLTDQSHFNLDHNITRIPTNVLYGLSILGGSPGQTFAMIAFGHRKDDLRFKLNHYIICGTQCILLMSIIQFQHPSYTWSLQISHTRDEFNYACSSFWNALVDRLNYNTRFFCSNRLLSANCSSPSYSSYLDALTNYFQRIVE